MAVEPIKIAPQPGPQEAFLATSADIAIYGGGAGGGKTYALLLEALRHIDNKNFGAVIFRRESVQITNEGGLWDEAMKLYPLVYGKPFRAPKLGFRFPRGGRVTFAHLNMEDDVLSWQGGQVPLIGYDELTHFTRKQFLYMLSRNRSTSGVTPYVRATCNPDADSWLADFLSWWIDQDPGSPRYGLPIPERAGVVRYLVVISDAFVWGDSREELVERHGVTLQDCKSVTFIPASVFDNQKLLQIDPGYLANLKALSRVDRERLLGGNWKIRPAAGLYFPRHCVGILDVMPTDLVEEVRGWDLGGTPPTPANPSPDATAGVRMARRRNGRYVVQHVNHLRGAAHKVRDAISATAQQDGKSIKITVPQDPGQAGKDQASNMVAGLAGYAVIVRRPSKDKVTRAEPFAAQWQAGNVDLLRGPWNDTFLGELEAFPDGHDDQVDAASDAFAVLAVGAPDISQVASSGTRDHTSITGPAAAPVSTGWGAVPSGVNTW